jgi:hypothetical protein
MRCKMFFKGDPVHSPDSIHKILSECHLRGGKRAEYLLEGATFREPPKDRARIACSWIPIQISNPLEVSATVPL